MRQRGLTVLTEVIPERVDDLIEYLNTIGQNIRKTSEMSFKDFQTIHFMRWVVLPVDPVVKNPPQLVLSTNYDGPLDDHLADLVRVGGEGLRKIYSHCKGAPKGNEEDWKRYLRQHRQRNAAFYTGSMGRTVSQVRQEQELWEWMEETVSGGEVDRKWSRKQIQEFLKKRLEEEPEFKWTEKIYRRPFLQWGGTGLLLLGLLAFFALIGVGFAWNAWITGAVLLLTVGVIVELWMSLRSLEKKDKANFKPSRKDAERIALLNTREDYKVQNQITHLVRVKPGMVRQFWLRFVLGAINLLARTFYNKGNLGGIPSIHYARWVILDGGKRLLFFSNYDGSWESYLGEFVDRAAIGLTGVWSNTEGFPPTNHLIKSGARYSTWFKAWTRAQQIETQVWYSAYPTISVKNINNNTAIRQGIRKNLDEQAAEEWLQRL